MASDLECEEEELNRLKEENEKLRSMTFSLVRLSPSGGQCLLPIWKGQVLSVSGGLWTPHGWFHQSETQWLMLSPSLYRRQALNSWASCLSTLP